MKKVPLESTTHNGGECLAPILAITALVFLLLMAGCTTRPAAEPVATPPATTVQTAAATTLMTVVPTATEESASTIADRAFADAADACYQKTPVITNISTHLEFATCMKDTPLPSGNCARNYRYYVLKSTNEDANSAGFARETTTARLAREAFLRGEGYDGIRLEYVPCGNATLIKTSFYQ
jgi:hypothetical protein